MGFLDNVKIFADKAVKKTGEVAELAVKKGGEVAELAKLNLSLKNEEIKLNKLFCSLGKLCYERADVNDIAKVIVEIDDIQEIIAELKAEIAASNGKLICKGCGKEISDEDTFCKYCGAKVPVKKTGSETKATASKTAVSSDAPKAEEPKSTKPLTTEEFVDTFKSVLSKYGYTKK